jgi:hypothetical protein
MNAPGTAREALKNRRVLRVFGIVLALDLAALCVTQTGCPQAVVAVTATCKVVDVLHDGCMLLTFIGDDEAPHNVTCSPDELNAWGKEVEKRHKIGATWHPAP